MTPEQRAAALVRVVPIDQTSADEVHYFDLALVALVSFCGAEPAVVGRRRFTELHDAIAREITEAVTEATAGLRAAIAKHRDQRGHDRCFLDDQELYAAIGDAPVDQTLPPREEFLAGCARYHELRKSGESHDHLSLPMVLDENQRLRKAMCALAEELTQCSSNCHDTAEWSLWDEKRARWVYACDKHRTDYEEMRPMGSTKEAMKLFRAAHKVSK